MLVIPNKISLPEHCQCSATLTARSATIDPTAVGSPWLSLPGHPHRLHLVNRLPDNKHAYHYSDPGGSDLLFTYNPDSRGLHGNFRTSTGRSFTIEHCFGEAHVWSEIDVESLEHNAGVDTLEGSLSKYLMPSPLFRRRQTDMADTTTMVTFSIKFYYTATFAARTPDIDGFVDQVVADINQGYVNSKVALTARQHCKPELASIDDQPSASRLLSQFAAMKPTWRDVRGSADVAHLLVYDFDSCGIGFTNTIDIGLTFSATAKVCAASQYSVGHEIAHNIGSLHNREASVGNNNLAYTYGHGHLIAKGSTGQGFRKGNPKQI